VIAVNRDATFRGMKAGESNRKDTKTQRIQKAVFEEKLLTVGTSGSKRRLRPVSEKTDTSNSQACGVVAAALIL